MELTRVCEPQINKTTKSKDFIVYKGITFRPTFKFKDSEGDPISLANMIVTFHIATKTGTNILTINSEDTTTNGSTIEIIDEANGIVDILITDEETSSLTFQEGRWWVTLTTSNGDILLRGKGSIFSKEPYN